MQYVELAPLYLLVMLGAVVLLNLVLKILTGKDSTQ